MSRKVYGLVTGRCSLPTCSKPTAVVLRNVEGQRFSFCRAHGEEHARLGYRADDETKAAA